MRSTADVRGEHESKETNRAAAASACWAALEKNFLPRNTIDAWSNHLAEPVSFSYLHKRVSTDIPCAPLLYPPPLELESAAAKVSDTG
jgi:hypothetical protein